MTPNGRADDSTMTTSEVMVLIGYTTTRAARAWCSRHRVEAVSRDPGRSGENRYRRADVLAGLEKMPGQGARTDLAPPNNYR